jgi:hypothetical protein
MSDRFNPGAEPEAGDGLESSDTADAGGATEDRQLAQGVACTETSDCASGLFCVDSICCIIASCPAMDQCHQAGTCAPSTGLCTNPIVEDGAACDDGNACSQIDTCRDGVCIGSIPIQCNAIDICHSTGTCDPNTGACSTPPAQSANCGAGQPCLAWYPDCDSDGYGDVDASPICSTSSPGVPPCVTGIYVQDHTDCCDNDSRANPGQTGWFTGQNDGGTDHCGFWNYGCGAVPVLEYTNLAACAPACPPARAANVLPARKGPHRARRGFPRSSGRDATERQAVCTVRRPRSGRRRRARGHSKELREVIV